MSIKGLNPRFWHLNHHIKPRQTPCHVRCVLRDTIFSIPIQGTRIFSYLSWQIGFRGGYWFSLVERGHGYPISRIKCWHTFLEFLPPASAVEVIESVLCFHDVLWRHKMTSWPQLTSQNDVMTSNNVSMAKTTMTYTREVSQRWGVFICNIPTKIGPIFIL